MPPKRRHISIDSSEENPVQKRRRTNDPLIHNNIPSMLNLYVPEDESSSEHDLSRVSEEKSYNSEHDYPDEESLSRSESTRGGSRGEDSEDSDEPNVVDLSQDPDLPSPDPRLSVSRPRPRRAALNNNTSSRFMPPRRANSELINIDDEEPIALFSPRSARVAQALLGEEEIARRKREDDDRKSEQLARRLLQQELEMTEHHYHVPRSPTPVISPPRGAEMSDEELARMLQEQEDQMASRDEHSSGLSSYSRRLLNAPRFVSPVRHDYSDDLLYSPVLSPRIRMQHFHHHTGRGHRHHHGSPMSYESLVNLEPVKVAAKNIHLLPVSVYNKENVKNSAEQSSCCSICLDDFETGDKVKTLPCFHAFHAACVDKWLKMNHVCPVCKKEVDTE